MVLITYCLLRARKNVSFVLRNLHQTLPNHGRPEKRRVVITGLGVVSPVGCNVDTAWRTILDGQSKIGRLEGESYDKLPCRVAATIDKKDIDLENCFTKTELKTMARATAFALIAAKEALTTAGWTPSIEDENACQRTGVAIGMGMVDLMDICETNEALKKGYNRVSPFFVPRILPNMPAGQLSIRYGFRGPNHAVSTACATGAHSIGDAFRFIQHGDADVMVCGGAEACISPLGIAGFCRLRALSTAFNDEPALSSRPFDKQRDGFVMGEGSAIFVLEELQHAKGRNAPIIGEVLGYGLSGDASHLTAPREDGTGAILAMKRALADANLSPADVGYVNAHATSTPIGDAIEARSIRTLFGEHAQTMAVSSTKGAHGHLLGAAGNLEAMFTLLACKNGTLPPTVNLEHVTDDMKGLHYIANRSEQWESNRRRIALKNSFGFGGTNACLCIGEYSE
ncbi:3-oxoacyl-[acyl-carrier-protein] synthase, mitochondrial [Anopheles ziemanni]|uniref:3-oxoacyl-[acyl-carrier-protein] synthase, mitochondrial n=1 Tax=Anopheles coustani TaxID=139045 RepID=UPI00265A2DB6|nr:3-oxoacyl-[acyl-carrier-protein] synthase, mitochondrial [Anopheles coustani]XP_058169321.1 3-oxoacyl-[acyl-carrier-protein] synthase, mitochondrial [Anopheles ziemanni]